MTAAGPCARWLLPPRPREPGARRVIVAMGGDGVGPEVVAAAVRALRATGAPIEIREPAHGAPAVEAGGEAFPAATRAECDRADAVLFGAAEKASLPVMGYLRRTQDVSANIRPALGWLAGARAPATDLVLVRELSEGLYPAREGELAELARRWPEFRDRWGRPLPASGKFAVRVVTEQATRRVGRYAAQLALHRLRTGAGRGRVTIVTKSNVLAQSDGLFHEICKDEVRAASGELACDQLYVDEAARRLVAAPEAFDVIVTTNLFGDILSDVASEMAGGMPQSPSAALGDTFAYFEPVHGSAPELAGKDLANPIGAMMSAAMILQYLDCAAASARLADAIQAVWGRGIRTADAGGSAGTRGFTDAVCAELERG